MNRKNYISLAVKNALMYLVIITLSSLFIGYTIYRLSAVLIVSSAKKQLNDEVKGIARNLTEVFDHIGRDVQFLAHSPVVTSYLTNPNEMSDKVVQDEFKSMLASKPSYFQIRLIGLADSGMEKVRVERINSVPLPISQDKLQRKGDRIYFKETVKVSEGGVYFSEIDLNQEYGKLQVPYMPTLRVGCPLYMNGMLYGIIIINIELKQVFEKLQQVVGHDKEIFVFNNAGYFLIHPDESQTFGFEFNKGPNVSSFFKDLSEWFPDLVKTNSPDTILSIDSKFITAYYALEHPRTNYKLLFALRAVEDQILSPFNHWRNTTIFTTMGITLVFLGLAFYWMQRQSKQLNRITKSIVQFAGNYHASKNIYSQSDEIGDLANAFNEMADTIRSNVIALEKSNAMATEANKTKEEFLENISHEIRNPVQSILGMTKILEENEPKSEQRPVIKSLQFSANQLLHLVNDVLDFTKFKTGQIQLKPSATRLYPLLIQTMESNQYLAISKNIKIILEFPPAYQNLQVHLDAMRLSQILNNLIVNAIKFSHHQTSIKLVVSVLSQSNDILRIEFKVIDEGIGINDEELIQIKKRYFSNDLNGTGLGLHIVNQFLRLFHSELQIQSIKNVGSQFSFILNLNNFHAEEMKIAEKEKLPAVIQMQAALVIDDDPQVLYYLEYILKKLRVHNITTCGAIPDFEKIAHQGLFDILIVDAMVPENEWSSYFAGLNAIRSKNGLLILHSGILHPGPDKLRGLNIDAFVQKPSNQEDFINLIDSLWYDLHISLPDMTMFYKDYDLNPDLIKSALKILLSEWRQMTEKLLSAVRSGDQDAFEQVYHKLIASIKRFGLASLQEYLLEIQFKIRNGEKVDNADIEFLTRKLEKKERFFEQELNRLEKVPTSKMG